MYLNFPKNHNDAYVESSKDSLSQIHVWMKWAQ